MFSETTKPNTTHTVKYTCREEEYQMEGIRGSVTCKYDDTVAHVLQVNDNEIQLTFLHPSGPSKFFMYPSPQDIS